MTEKAILVTGGTGVTGQVSREDVAEVCVQILSTNWNTLFDEVAKDMQNASIER